MPALRQESSAEIAAAFVERREARERQGRERQRARARKRERRERRLLRQLSRTPAAPPEQRGPRRIALDFAEPTLCLIHEVLLDAMHANIEFGDRGALLMIAEQMVAVALGDPPCDDPPLTDREVR